MGVGSGARLASCFQASGSAGIRRCSAPKEGPRRGAGCSDPQAVRAATVTRRYPVAIEHGTETAAFGVVVPDLPGCFSAGDTLDEAMLNVEEAVAAWLDAALDAGQAVPEPSSLDAISSIAEFSGWTFAVVSIDPTLLDDTVERVNITLPRRVLKRLDALARAAGETRSGYIAQLTLDESRSAA